MALSDLRGVLQQEAFDGLEDVEKELYTERDGNFELTGIPGTKSENDVRRLQLALEKERGDHKSTRDKAGVWGDLEHGEVMGRLDRIPELEAAAADKIDEVKLDEMAEKRALSRLKPLEREKLTLTETLAARDATILQYETANSNRIISDTLRKAGNALKMLDPDDAITFGRSSFRINEAGEVLTEEGLTAEQYLVDLQVTKSHLWSPSVGGGAQGGGSGGAGGGSNPFTAENWSLTEQGRVYREHGSERAGAMAKAAGTTVGGLKPRPKK